MSENLSQPILPITIVPLDGGRQQERSFKDKDVPTDLRHWQIEEFLRQKGKAENTQRSYRQQLQKFSSWCNKSWLDITSKPKSFSLKSDRYNICSL
jgi:integrase/recombinase XerD